MLQRSIAPARIARSRTRAVVALALLGLAASGVAGTSPAAAAVAPKPTIVSFASAPKKLTADGGAVRLSVRVKNATTCTFKGQGAPFSSLNRVKTVPCAGGRASAVLTVAPNTRSVPATIHYYVRAAAKGRSVQKTLTVVEAGAPDAGTITPPAVPPPTIDTAPLPAGAFGAAYSATLSASGGTPPYTWSLVSGSLPMGTSLSLTGTIAGTPIQAGTFSFTVEVADSALQNATAALSISVSTPNLPVDPMSRSLNWSGYALEGGPFTSVTGTFNVPDLTNLSGSVTTSEWVGIDGHTQGNQDLIQAGVAEDYGRFGNGVQVYAWWEILPAAETPIDSLDVSPGDSMTVTIAQLSAGQWSIQLVNNTSGGTFSITQPYTGRGLSAEWVVEAPTSGRSSQILTLGQYTPAVTFTRIGWAGSAKKFVPITMQQQGVSVSTPSPLSADQSSFSVAYGDTAPATP